MTIENYSHDLFFKILFGDTRNTREILEYMKSINPTLKGYFKSVDLDTLQVLPNEIADMETMGYADLAFTAKFKEGGNICIGIIMEHKSYRDDNVLNQLEKYRYFLMKQRVPGISFNGMPTIAIIVYNGKEKWNPTAGLARYPEEVMPLLLPFRCEVLNVLDIPEENYEKFNPVLALGLGALRNIWNFEKFKPILEKYGEAAKKALGPGDYLALMERIDVYFRGEVSANCKEMFKMDFVRPPYKTIRDVDLEEAAAKSREQALKVGREEGEYRKAREMAKAMIADNVPLPKIAAYTGLSEEEIKAL